MELKEFIKTAITDITDAVSELQSELNNGAIVNPAIPHPISNGSIDTGAGNQPIQSVEFDVALTTSEAASVDGNAKGGITVFSAKVGTSQQAQSQNVSRLTFIVPVVLPAVRVQTAAEKKMQKSQEGLRKLRAEIDSECHENT